MYFLKVYFLKVYFLKVYFFKVYLLKVYLLKVYFLKVYFPKVYSKEVSILGQNFFDPKVTQPRVFKLSVPGGLRIFRAFASLLDISEVNRKAIYRTRSAGQNLSQYIGCTRECIVCNG